MTWIQPLELEKWMINVFAGTPTIFTAVAIIFIMGLAGYFRMTYFSAFFMLLTFFLMFTGVVSTSLYVLVAIFGSLIAGYILSNIFNR